MVRRRLYDLAPVFLSNLTPPLSFVPLSHFSSAKLASLLFLELDVPT